jgi:transcription elongation GreA/GreB family factor
MVGQSSLETVHVGCWVKITGFEPDEVETYFLVEDAEADPGQLKIGASNPLAQALTGKRIGERISWGAPNRDVELTVVDFGPMS